MYRCTNSFIIVTLRYGNNARLVSGCTFRVNSKLPNFPSLMVYAITQHGSSRFYVQQTSLPIGVIYPWYEPNICHIKELKCTACSLTVDRQQKPFG